MPDVSIIVGFVAIVILLCFSAMISGSEVAFFALSPQDREKLESERSLSATKALELINAPKSLLATILIGNNLVNVAIILISTLMVDSLVDAAAHPVLVFVIEVVLITSVILTFGEISPKVYASGNTYRTVLLTAYPLALMRKFFYPLSYLLVAATKRFSASDSDLGSRITADELSHALELTTDQNTNEDEKRILTGIVKFGSTEVRQVMTPRVNVVGIDQSTDFNTLQKHIVEFGFSRIPVYNEDFDHVVGVLYIKDLLPHLDIDPTFNWNKLVRPALFVTENKKLDDLLREFQKSKSHLAIVVDEYGGSSGVITLEDIIEEIVGEISDEFDEEEVVYSKLDEDNYVFEGRTALMDMYRIMAIDGKTIEAAKGDSDSIAGFILELSGRIPQKNESVRFDRFQFTIEASDRRRIKQVKVSRMPITS